MQKQTITINTDFIKLDQLLKFSGVADTGAVAKDMILSEMVYYNGDICTMRGKKVRSGDIIRIKFEDEDLELTIEDK